MTDNTPSAADGCPFCGDPMEIHMDHIRHIAPPENCPIGFMAMPVERLEDWNTRADRHLPAAEPVGLSHDVVQLVIAARELAFSDHRPVGQPDTQAEVELIELFDNLDKALEAFGSRVGWNEEPDDIHQTSAPVACGGCGETDSRKRCIGCLHDFGAPNSAWVHIYATPPTTPNDASAAYAKLDAEAAFGGMTKREAFLAGWNARPDKVNSDALADLIAGDADLIAAPAEISLPPELKALSEPVAFLYEKGPECHAWSYRCPIAEILIERGWTETPLIPAPGSIPTPAVNAELVDDGRGIVDEATEDALIAAGWVMPFDDRSAIHIPNLISADHVDGTLCGNGGKMSFNSDDTTCPFCFSMFFSKPHGIGFGEREEGPARTLVNALSRAKGDGS